MLSCDNDLMDSEEYIFMRPRHGTRRHGTRRYDEAFKTFCNRGCDGWVLEPEASSYEICKHCERAIRALDD